MAAHRELTLYSGPNQEFVEALIDSGARFLIRGGVAVNYYDPSRPVGDLDLLMEPSLENAQRVFRVLPRFVQPAFRVEELARPGVGFRETAFLNLDVLTARPEVDFAAHWDDAVEATFRGKPVCVASIRTLLELQPRPDDVVRLNAILARNSE